MSARRILSKSLTFFASSSPPFRHHSAAAAAAPVSRSDNLLTLLRSRGLAAGDITGFSSRGLLDAKLGRQLGAKFDLLLSLGFSASDVAKLLQKSALLSKVSLSNLKQRIEFLKSVVDDDAGGVMKMIKSSIRVISGPATNKKRIADNIAILKEWGVPGAKIKYLLLSHTRFFQLKSKYIIAAAKRSQIEFGVTQHEKMFLYHVIGLLAQSDSTRQEKIRVFERFGWQNSDVHALARTSPLCLTLSAAKLEKGLEFLMNTAGFNPSSIASRPSMLQLSLERRVSPRYHLIQALKSKCLVGKNLSFSTVAKLTENDFRRKFVDKFLKLEPDVCEAYLNRVPLAQKKKPVL